MYMNKIHAYDTVQKNIVYMRLCKIYNNYTTAPKSWSKFKTCLANDESKKKKKKKEEKYIKLRTENKKKKLKEEILH